MRASRRESGRLAFGWLIPWVLWCALLAVVVMLSLGRSPTALEQVGALSASVVLALGITLALTRVGTDKATEGECEVRSSAKRRAAVALLALAAVVGSYVLGMVGFERIAQRAPSALETVGATALGAIALWAGVCVSAWTGFAVLDRFRRS